MRSSQHYPNSDASTDEELDTLYDPAYVEWVSKIRKFLKSSPNLTVAEFDNLCNEHPEAYLLFFADPKGYPFATEQFLHEYKTMENQRIADAAKRCHSPTLGQKKQDASISLASVLFPPARQSSVLNPTPEPPTRLNITAD